MYRKLSLLFICLSVSIFALTLTLPTVIAQESNQDVYGRDLPEDAAPYEQQIWTQLCDSTRTETSLASVITVYQRICGDTHMFDKFGDALVDLDENLDLI